jgi:hypothetical protein
VVSETEVVKTAMDIAMTTEGMIEVPTEVMIVVTGIEMAEASAWSAPVL